MKKSVAAIFLALTLAACQTTENFEAMLDSWIGIQEVELVRRWGVPDQTFESGGSRFLVYESRREVSTAGTPPTFIATIVDEQVFIDPVGGVPPSTRTLLCVTTFELIGSRIVAWRAEGNYCVAPPPDQ